MFYIVLYSFGRRIPFGYWNRRKWKTLTSYISWPWLIELKIRVIIFSINIRMSFGIPITRVGGLEWKTGATPRFHLTPNYCMYWSPALARSPLFLRLIFLLVFCCKPKSIVHPPLKKTNNAKKKKRTGGDANGRFGSRSVDISFWHQPRWFNHTNTVMRIWYLDNWRLSHHIGHYSANDTSLMTTFVLLRVIVISRIKHFFCVTHERGFETIGKAPKWDKNGFGFASSATHRPRPSGAGAIEHQVAHGVRLYVN